MSNYIAHLLEFSLIISISIVNIIYDLIMDEEIDMWQYYELLILQKTL